MTDLTVLNAAIEKMHWNEARQKVISQNVANADTPGYQPQEIAPLDFKALLKSSSSSLAATGGSSVTLATTDPKHLGLNGAAASGIAKPKNEKSPYETSPAGNAVVLEEQLMKLNQNALDHKLSATIYQKNIELLKTAVKSQ